MSFSDVHPGDPINASNVQQVIDALKGTAGKGVPLSPTAVNNSTSYALTVENLEATNSRALNVLKSDGSTLIKADATGVTLGSPITAPAASLPGSVLQNGSVHNAALASDTARANLLTNGGFEVWQRGNGPFSTNLTYTADRWGLSLAGTDTLSVSRNTASADTANGSVACAACTYTAGSGANSQLQATLKSSDGFQLTGRTFSFSVRCSASAANAARVIVQGDGGFTNVTSAFHPGGSTYQTLTATFTCTSTQTQIVLGLDHVASCTAYWDSAMLVVGGQPADYAPMHPADDLARCARYYEQTGAPSGSQMIVGYCYSGSAAYAQWWYKAQKAVTPTVTTSAVATWVLLNANASPIAATSISASNQYTDRAGFTLGVSSGLVAGNATVLQCTSGNSASLIAEANP